MKRKLEGEVTIDVDQCVRLTSPRHVGGPTDAIAKSDVLRIAARAEPVHGKKDHACRKGSLRHLGPNSQRAG